MVRSWFCHFLMCYSGTLLTFAVLGFLISKMEMAEISTSQGCVRHEGVPKYGALGAEPDPE